MVFNFHHLKVDYTNGEKWTNAPFDFLQLKSIFNHWQTGLNGKGWGALFWCNHDQPRVVSRLGNDQQYRVESAKMLAASVHMMQGTPYIYQGEEIGMTNPGYTEISQYRDVESTNMYDIMVNRDGVAHQDMMAILAQKSRDNSRTPMQWNSEPYAGFSQAQPWLDVANNYTEINAEQALEDKDSVFYFYKALIELRKQVPVITHGRYQDLLPEHPSIFAYVRESEGQTLLCINNYYGEETECVLPERFEMMKAKSLLSNYQVSESLVTSHHQVLRPYETRILLIED